MQLHAPQGVNDAAVRLFPCRAMPTHTECAVKAAPRTASAQRCMLWESLPEEDSDRPLLLVAGAFTLAPGHSGGGRCSAGKDILWYTREKKDDQEQQLREELQAIKDREEDLMLEVGKLHLVVVATREWDEALFACFKGRGPGRGNAPTVSSDSVGCSGKRGRVKQGGLSSQVIRKRVQHRQTCRCCPERPNGKGECGSGVLEP